MLIVELLGRPLELNEGAGIDLQHEVDDILLRARKGNIENLNLHDLAGELNKSAGIYIDADNAEFRQKLTDVLLQNDWVQSVAPTGRIIIKTPGEFQPDQGEEPGAEVKKGREEQERKTQKIASKNIKNGGSEL